MLKTVLKKLNGGASDPAKVSESLAALLADRTETTRTIDELQRERKQALLDDATDAVIDAIERKIDRATVKLEKIGLAEAPLRAQLETAKAEARQAALVRHFAAYASAYQALRDAVSKAEDAQVALFALRERAARAVGEHVVQTRFPIISFGGILGTGGHVTQWTRESDAAVAAARASINRTPAPAKSKPPAIVVQPPAPKRATGRVGENVVIHLPSALTVTKLEPAALARRLPDDDQPLADGNVRARVLREGYSDQDGGYCAPGRKIQLPRAIAEAAAKNGAVEIVSGGQ